ncbi:hypothetical protein [Arthrobacter sp. JCM 19049]|uniref:hypothetical protein n=1 Tax=Arthrobacter sp. JCM 19049 TaxID=1460643 RepID=UPI002795723E|nr:hypothetical protein [Arthrobacter sp. JCM 19049]
MVPRHHTSDEQELTGFFAPDDTEVFFSSPQATAAWEAEFGVGAPATPAGPITGIDT